MSPETTSAIVGAILGWAFGLFSAPITERMTRRQVARSLASPIEAELRELRDRAAMHFWQILKNHGALTREDVQWTIDALANADLDRAQPLLSILRALLARPDAEVTAALAVPDPTGISTRKVDAPFIGAHLERLHVYAPVTQRALLNVATDVRLHNELVDEVRNYVALTFDPASTNVNNEAIRRNLRSAQAACAKTARQLANHAASALNALVADPRR